MNASLVEVLITILLLLGSFFILVGAIGLVRLPDFFMRLHGPTVAITLGVGCVLLGVLVYGGSIELALRELLITMFLFVTAPVSAYLLAQAGLRQKLASRAPRPDDAIPPPPADDDGKTR